MGVLKRHELLLERAQIIFKRTPLTEWAILGSVDQFPVDAERPQWAEADLNSPHIEQSAVLDPTETMGSARLQPVVQICLLCAG